MVEKGNDQVVFNEDSDYYRSGREVLVSLAALSCVLSAAEDDLCPPGTEMHDVDTHVGEHQ